MDDEDLIQREDMVVLVSHGGYIKRAPLSTYRAQRRGGKGRAGMATRDEDFVARLFVASTHQPVLFFSSTGQVYKEKVWRLPLAAPQARGKALVNLLPLEQGERITTIMPLPEDEATWEALDVMFATTRGTVRRNKLSDFAQVNRAGKIAMRLDEGEQIVDVQICSEADDVLLTTAQGRCIRFPVGDVRVFKGRNSMGVRGITLDKGDTVISLAILNAFEATAEERAAYLKQRRALAGETADDSRGGGRGRDGERTARADADAALSPERFEAMQRGRAGDPDRVARTATASAPCPTSIASPDAAAKASSRWRSTRATASWSRRSRSRTRDEIMLVTDGGQLIRVPVAGIRIAGRATQGVIVFNTAEQERVVSVDRIGETEGSRRRRANRPARLRRTYPRAIGFDALRIPVKVEVTRSTPSC